MKHQLIVGNIGSVLVTESRSEALKTFAEYYHQSLASGGRASGESITWLVDGEPVVEFVGEFDVPEGETWHPLYEIVDHGIDHAQYFRGCGVSHTPFKRISTGCGENGWAALDDALENIAMSDNSDRNSAIIACIEHETEDQKEAYESISVTAQLEANGELDEDGNVPEGCELYYYLSIRY